MQRGKGVERPLVGQLVWLLVHVKLDICLRPICLHLDGVEVVSDQKVMHTVYMRTMYMRTVYVWHTLRRYAMSDHGGGRGNVPMPMGRGPRRKCHCH